MSGDLLYAGDAYIKTNSASGVAWVLRYITLTPYALEWFAGPNHESVGTVQLAGAALLQAAEGEAPSGGAAGSLCVELDWSGQDFLPLFFDSPEDAHDAVLVRLLWRVVNACPAPCPSLHPLTLPPPPFLSPHPCRPLLPLLPASARTCWSWRACPWTT